MSGTGDVLDKHRPWLKKRPAECVTWTWGSFRDHGILAEAVWRPSLHRRKAPVEHMGPGAVTNSIALSLVAILLNS